MWSGGSGCVRKTQREFVDSRKSPRDRMRHLFRTQPEPTPHAAAIRSSIVNECPAYSASSSRQSRLCRTDRFANSVWLNQHLPAFSNQQCRSIRCNVLSNVLRYVALFRARRPTIFLCFAVHSLNSFSTSSISFFDPGYRFLYFSHSFLRPRRRISLGGVCSVFF